MGALEPAPKAITERQWGSLLLTAVGAVLAVVCTLAVIRTFSESLLEGRQSIWPGNSLPLRPAPLPQQKKQPLQQQQQPTKSSSRDSSRKPTPAPCNFSTLLDQSGVHWSKRNETADHLSIIGCPMKRYSHAEAKQCLAGKRLVFIGDSLTRYQYLALIYFLEKGDWPAPLGGILGQPSVTNEHEWPSWNDFLRGTNELFGGRELCDCYRREYQPHERRPPEKEKFENRFFVTEDGGTAVSHFTYTAAPNTVHGHFGFPPLIEGKKPCRPATCNQTADWAWGLTGALTKVVRPLQPTHLILNSGAWGSSNAVGDAKWQAIAAAGLSSVSEQKGRVIWRTTTASRGSSSPTRDHDTLAIKHTAAAGWGLLDAYAITLPLVAMNPRPMWDGRHFQALVYRELNLYLLNMICESQA